ncbi:HAMP domain-containing protein [Herbaspirillum sp. HC18]|nr:HAMP domain-containing protein [Herbaspirillum sp. HC18]
MFHNLSIKTRLIGIVAFLSIQLVIGGIIGLASLSNTNDAMKSIYDDRLVCLGQIELITREILRNESEIAKAVTSEPPAVAKIVSGVNDRIAAIDRAWNAYMATNQTPEEKLLADEFAEARRQYLTEGVRPALAALQTGDIQATNAVIHGPLTTLFEPIRVKGDALVKLQLNVAKSQYEQSQGVYRLVRTICIAATLFGIVLAGVVGWWLIRVITKPLDEAVQLATCVAEGNLTCHIEVRSGDETGRLMQALKNMRDSLVQMITIAQEMTRELRASEASLAEAQHMAHLGSWRLDPATQKMTWSTETFRVFGVEHLSEAPGFSGFLDRVHEEDRQRVQTGLERSIAAGEEFNAEHRIRRHDGSLRWVQTISRWTSNDGKALLHGTIMDITERKQTFESLKRSQELLRELTAYQDRLKEDERRRIAREIHDELGQTLLALRIDVSMLEARTGEAHPRLNQRVRSVLQHLDATVKTIRGIINNLRPTVLDLGLAAAIEWQVNEFRRRSGIACELVMDAEECVLDDQCSTTLFRILQESLTNVIRHANATHVLVELCNDGARLAMHIVDNGIGMYPEARRAANSFGLVGVEERIHALDGEFHVASTPGKGTALAIYIPLAKVGSVLPAEPRFSAVS